MPFAVGCTGVGRRWIIGQRWDTRWVKRADYAEAAGMLRRLLGAVKAGDLTVGTPQALALMRRREGAAAAFETVAGSPST